MVDEFMKEKVKNQIDVIKQKHSHTLIQSNLRDAQSKRQNQPKKQIMFNVYTYCIISMFQFKC